MGYYNGQSLPFFFILDSKRLLAIYIGFSSLILFLALFYGSLIKLFSIRF